MSMKAEDQSTQPASQTVPPQTSTPTPNYTTPQWAASQIPIDPQLQQQAQHATTNAYYQYTSHYPQAAYATHYQQYMASQQNAAVARTTTATPVTQQQQSQQHSNNAVDTADIANLKDALGSAGVDLRAEEESLQRSHDQHQSYRPYEDRTRKQPPKPSFDTRVIGTTMRTIGTQHKVTRIPEDSVNYLALALRARLQDLITAMITASRHRMDTQFDRPASLYDDGSPMWSIIVRSDVAKQLAALEKIEREEETKVRRERKERIEMAAAHTAALAAQANGGGNAMAVDSIGSEDAEGSKKKKKKDGPGVTARNMSEDVRKKMSNATATRAAGLGGKYAWMASASAASPTPKAKAGAPSTTPTTGATTSATSPATTTTPAGKNSASGSWARPYVPTRRESSATPAQSSTEEDTRVVVTMRDAMFVVEKERGHGGGRGAARARV